MDHLIGRLPIDLEGLCTRDTDPVDERRRKVTLVVLSAICVVASILWGTLYFAILGATITVADDAMWRTLTTALVA